MNSEIGGRGAMVEVGSSWVGSKVVVDPCESDVRMG